MCEPEKKRQRVGEEEEGEVWKTVRGHEEYEVSSIGNIRNAKTRRQVVPKACSPDGPTRVTLGKAKLGKDNRKIVSHLVASAFPITPQNDSQNILHHIDRNKSNNAISNLTLVSTNELADIFSQEMGEIFVPIPGFSNFFLSSKGRFFNHTTGKVLSQKHSHPIMRIQQDKKSKVFTIHLLMVSLFSIKPRTSDEYIIHHNDLNVWNNAVDNLRYISEKELAEINMKRVEDLNMLPGEEWRHCAKFPKYFVSSMGRVLNANMLRMHEQTVNLEGYKKVHLSKGFNSIDSVRTDKSVSTHRLVALAFIGNPPKNETVDHIDRVKSNNLVTNLRYATARDQALNRKHPGTRKTPAVISTCLDSGEVVIFRKVDEAANFMKASLGMNQLISSISSNIYSALSKNDSYLNYGWEYDILLPTGDIRELPSHPGYMISSCGMYMRPGGHWTAGTKNANGYKIVRPDGVEQRLHRLVMEVFRTQDPSPEQIFVNHINGKKNQNNIQNLAYVTVAENNQHAHDTGLNSSKKSVLGTNIESGVSVTYASMRVAARETESLLGGISLCCKGKQKKSKGFTWRFT